MAPRQSSQATALLGELEPSLGGAPPLAVFVRHSFTAFAHMAVRVLVGAAAPDYLMWHVRAMAHVVEEVDAGSCKRLIVTVPPRHLKSTVVTAAQIAWRLGRDPAIKILLVCYSKELAKDLLGKVRTLLAHPWYQQAFPGVALRVKRADLIETYAGGKVIATSFGGGFTGMGADLIIVDDPIRAQAAFSERQRERCIRTFDEGLRSRLDDPANGAIVVVMQRLHEEDLVGHLLAQGGWHELRLPLIAEVEHEIPLSADTRKLRARGSTIDPSRISIEIAQEIDRSVGSVIFGAQYQQDPQPAEGNLLRVGNMGTYPSALPLDDYDEIVIAVDTAIETGEANDYTACVVLGRWGHRIHVLRVERHRVSFTEQLLLVCQLNRVYRGAQVLIEAANSGRALIQQLRREHALHVTPVASRLSKEQRAVSVAALLENGDVCLPTAAEWLEGFLRELRTFPHGLNDDMVDAFVYGLSFLKRHIDRERPRRFPPPDSGRPVTQVRPRGDVRPSGVRERRRNSQGSI